MNYGTAHAPVSVSVTFSIVDEHTGETTIEEMTLELLGWSAHAMLTSYEVCCCIIIHIIMSVLSIIHTEHKRHNHSWYKWRKVAYIEDFFEVIGDVHAHARAISEPRRHLQKLGKCTSAGVPRSAIDN